MENTAGHGPDTYTVQELGRDLDEIVAHVRTQRAIVEAAEPLLARFLATASGATIPEEYCTPSNSVAAGFIGDTVEDRGFKVARLYRGARGRFCIMSMMWPAGASSGVHDHNGTWVVEGVYRNSMVATQFTRTDDGSRPGHAELRRVDSRAVGPGEVTHVLSPGREIHEYSNPTNVPAVSVHIYGAADPLREVCNYFDLEANAVLPTPPYDFPYDNEVVTQ